MQITSSVNEGGVRNVNIKGSVYSLNRSKAERYVKGVKNTWEGDYSDPDGIKYSITVDIEVQSFPQGATLNIIVHRSLPNLNNSNDPSGPMLNLEEEKRIFIH